MTTDDQHDQHDQPAPIFVDVKAAARLLSVSEGSVWRLLHRGDLPSVKIGSLRRIRVADLHQLGDDTSDNRFDNTRARTPGTR